MATLALEALQEFIEVSPDAMVCAGAGGNLVAVNRQAAEMFGYGVGELMGRSVEVLLPGRFHTVHVGHREGFTANPHMRPMGEGRELFASRADGSEFPVEISLAPIETDAGRVIAAAIRDTSERAAVEHRFRALLDSAPDPMVIVDDSGAIVLVNIQAEQVLGYGRDEMHGQTIEMLIPERFRHAHLDHRAGFFAAPKAREMGSGRELFALTKDGRELPVEISLSPIETDQGTWVAAALRDVTERRATLEAQEIARAKEQQLQHLQEINTFRREFINAAAHELNTPMTPLAATYAILRREGLPPEGREQALATMGRNIRRLESLIDDLLIAARQQSGRLTIVRREGDMEAIAQACIENYASIAAEKEITVVGDAAPWRVRADFNRLEQVFDNLLSNALKFTPQGGAVEVGVRPGRFWIQDNGVGLTPAQIEQIGQPFQRFMENIEGTGLGLYIARSLVEAHGGKLTVTSAGLGKGARFEVTLPETVADTDSPVD